MTVLIVYGTVEGQTQKIAEYMANCLREQDHKVDLANAEAQPPAPDHYDRILIGSSIHKAEYNPAVRSYVRNHLRALKEKHTAFFSVSMSIISEIEEEQAEVRGIATTFLAQMGWSPTHIAHMAGALKYREYNYFMRLVMRMIAKRNGRDTDTSKDHEYTDWDAVREFVAEVAG